MVLLVVFVGQGTENRKFVNSFLILKDNICRIVCRFRNKANSITFTVKEVQLNIVDGGCACDDFHDDDDDSDDDDDDSAVDDDNDDDNAVDDGDDDNAVVVDDGDDGSGGDDNGDDDDGDDDDDDEIGRAHV